MRKMTVKELKAILETYPDDQEVSAYYALYIGNKKIELSVKEI